MKIRIVEINNLVKGKFYVVQMKANFLHFFGIKQPTTSSILGWEEEYRTRDLKDAIMYKRRFENKHRQTERVVPEHEQILEELDTDEVQEGDEEVSILW